MGCESFRFFCTIVAACAISAVVANATWVRRTSEFTDAERRVAVEDALSACLRGPAIQDAFPLVAELARDLNVEPAKAAKIACGIGSIVHRLESMSDDESWSNRIKWSKAPGDPEPEG